MDCVTVYLACVKYRLGNWEVKSVYSDYESAYSDVEYYIDYANGALSGKVVKRFVKKGLFDDLLDPQAKTVSWEELI